EILEWEILVRRMRPAIGQSEAKEKSLRAQDVAKLRHDRDASAFANERDLLAECVLQSALRRLSHPGVRIGQIPRATVPVDDLHRHAGRQMFFEMPVRQFQNRGAI